MSPELRSHRSLARRLASSPGRAGWLSKARRLLLAVTAGMPLTLSAQDKVPDMAWLTEPATAPTSLSILDPCADPVRAGQALEDLATLAENLLVQGAVQAESQRRVALDAVAVLRRADDASAARICGFFESRPELRRVLEQAAVASRSSSACLDKDQFLSILITHYVFEALARLLDGVCNAAGCIPPIFAAPVCKFACAPPYALRLISAAFVLTMNVDDKCSVLEHREWMQTMRIQVNQQLVVLSNDLSVTMLPALADVSSSSVSEDDIARLDQLVDDGFAAAGAREASASGLNPQLLSLHQSLLDATAQQSGFDQQLLEQFIEEVLASGAVVHKLQLPESAGGLLHAVRELVARRLLGAAEGGLPTDQALLHFRAGDQAYNAQQYQPAYTAYALAYQSLHSVRKQGAHR